LSILEAGRTGTYQVFLSAQPVGRVTVTPESSDENVATVSGSLTFTSENWAEPQIVVVTAVNDRDDNEFDRTATVTHTVAGDGYDDAPSESVTVRAIDNEGARVELLRSGRPVALLEVTVSEDGRSSDTYQIRLTTDPKGSVTVTPTSSDPTVATVSGPLTFTSANWQTTQDVTVSGVNDRIDNTHDRTAAIRHIVSSDPDNPSEDPYNGVGAFDVTVIASL